MLRVFCYLTVLSSSVRCGARDGGGKNTSASLFYKKYMLNFCDSLENMCAGLLNVKQVTWLAFILWEKWLWQILENTFSKKNYLAILYVHFPQHINCSAIRVNLRSTPGYVTGSDLWSVFLNHISMNGLLKVANAAIIKRDTAAVLRKQYGDFRENCFPRPSGGCRCNVMEPDGMQTVKNYDSEAQCRVPVEGSSLIVISFSD